MTTELWQYTDCRYLSTSVDNSSEQCALTQALAGIMQRAMVVSPIQTFSYDSRLDMHLCRRWRCRCGWE